MITYSDLVMEYNPHTSILSVNATVELKWDEKKSVQIFKKSIKYMETNLRDIVYCENYKSRNKIRGNKLFSQILDENCKVISRIECENNVQINNEVFKLTRTYGLVDHGNRLEDIITFDNEFNIQVISEEDCKNTLSFIEEYLFNIYGVNEIFNTDTCESIMSDVNKLFELRQRKINEKLFSGDLEKLRCEQVAKNILKSVINQNQ